MKSIIIYTSIVLLVIASLFTVFFYLDSKQHYATFHTNYGDFKIKLYTDKTPITANNFIQLAEEGFYDQTKFHRVITNFMIQGGDPLSKDEDLKHRWGTGGPGYTIEDELVGLSNLRGTIAMANSGPNTGGSQFFINLVDNTHLDNAHAVFGEVVENIDVVDSIAEVQTNEKDQPVKPVVIEKIILSLE